MAEKVRSLIKVITGEINKHWLFNNANVTLSNAAGKTQEKLNNMQSAFVSKYDLVAKQVNNDITILQNLSATHLEPSPLPKRVIKWWQWYQQLTGLDTVEIAKQQVITAQDKLFKCQDERRHLNRQATLINDKLKEVYSELIQTKRDDPKYVQLTIIENKALQEQAKIISDLNLLEKEEKDNFTVLATAIKEYHDSQTMNAQKYKYLSIAASFVLAMLSLTGSMIYNNKRITNIRNVISETQQKNEIVFKSSIHTLEDNMNTKFSEILEILGNNNNNNNDNDNSSNTKNVNLLQPLDDRGFSMNLQNTYTKIGICIVALYIIKALTG